MLLKVFSIDVNYGGKLQWLGFASYWNQPVRRFPQTAGGKAGACFVDFSISCNI